MSIEVIVSGRFVDVLVRDDLTMADLPVLLKALEAARTRGPFVVLTDTTRMKNASRAVLVAFAERLKDLPPMKETWLADAVVISSGVTRFLLSTLILVAPLPTQLKVFERRAEAEAWCMAHLQKAVGGAAAHPPPGARAP
jgi:hypothetical protein